MTTLKEFVEFLEKCPVLLRCEVRYGAVQFSENSNVSISYLAENDDWTFIELQMSPFQHKNGENPLLKLKELAEKKPDALVAANGYAFAKEDISLAFSGNKQSLSTTALNPLKGTSLEIVLESVQGFESVDSVIAVLKEKLKGRVSVTIYQVGDRWFVYSQMAEQFPGVWYQVDKMKLFSKDVYNSSGIVIYKCLLPYDVMKREFGVVKSKV